MSELTPAERFAAVQRDSAALGWEPPMLLSAPLAVYFEMFDWLTEQFGTSRLYEDDGCWDLHTLGIARADDPFLTVFSFADLGQATMARLRWSEYLVPADATAEVLHPARPLGRPASLP